MSAKRVRVSAVLAALAGAFTAGNALAIEDFCNTATANFTNTNATAQPSVAGSTCFTAQSNPVLSVAKTRTPGSGAPGTTITFTVRVSYPRLTPGGADPNLCNDDNAANNVVLSDPLPIGPGGFTFVTGTLQVSADDGATYGGFLTEAADADAFTLTGTTVSVALSNLNEGDGDGTNCPAQAANAIRVRFQATKN